jgi:hypothetical protein
MNSKDRCPGCGGGLVPAAGCTCEGSTHTCIPAICNVCGGTGLSAAGVRCLEVALEARKNFVLDVLEQNAHQV